MKTFRKLWAIVRQNPQKSVWVVLFTSAFALVGVAGDLAFLTDGLKSWLGTDWLSVILASVWFKIVLIVAIVMTLWRIAAAAQRREAEGVTQTAAETEKAIEPLKAMLLQHGKLIALRQAAAELLTQHDMLGRYRDRIVEAQRGPQARYDVADPLMEAAISAKLVIERSALVAGIDIAAIDLRAPEQPLQPILQRQFRGPTHELDLERAGPYFEAHEWNAERLRQALADLDLRLKTHRDVAEDQSAQLFRQAFQ